MKTSSPLVYFPCAVLPLFVTTECGADTVIQILRFFKRYSDLFRNTLLLWSIDEGHSMAVGEIVPSDYNSESIVAILQKDATLQFACYDGLLFLLIQIALSRVAPGFDGHRWYSFFLLSLVGLTAGCAGWAWGIVLSPIGSQAGGAQKVLAGFAVFWTGVIVGNFSKIARAFSGWQEAAINQAARIELLFGLGVFLFAACITFNTRFVRVRDIP